MHIQDLKSIAIKTAILLWVAVCICAFMQYPGSKSFIHGSVIGNWNGLAPKISRIDVLGYFVSSVRSLLGLVVFCAACLGAGGSALAVLPFETTLKSGKSISRLASAASAFLIGQGLLSMVFLTLAELNQLRTVYVACTVAAAIGLGLCRLREHPLRHPIRQNLKFHIAIDSVDKLMALLSVVVLILSLSYTTSRLSFDATALYFSDAKITALTHSIRYFISDSYVASIFQAGINYAALIELFGDQAARMYSWAVGLVMIIFGIALAEELELSKRARIILLAMIVSSTAILDLLGDGKIDIVSTAPALAAIYWMIRNSAQSRREYILIGFLAGMAMADRPFNLALLPTIILLFELQQTLLRSGLTGTPKHRRFLESLLWIGIGATPWIAYILLSNWIILGDPIAFVKNYEKLRSGAYPLSFMLDSVWIFRLLYPFAITYWNSGESLGSISPLFLGLLPVLLRRTVRNQSRISGAFLSVVVAAGVTLLVWLSITSMVFEIRYVIFLWIILFMPVAAWASVAFDDPDVLIKSFVRLAVVSMLIFVSMRTIYISLDTYSPLDAHGNAHCYDLDRCVSLDSVNRIAQPGDRVLMLSAFRYYLRRDLFACSTTRSEYGALEDLSRLGSTAFWTETYREGNTFVVYQWDYTVGNLYLGMIPNPDNVPPWLSLTPIAGKPGDREVAYRIQAKNPPIPVDKKCISNGDTWEIQSVDNTAN